MSFRHTVFWSALILVFAVLILLILGLAVVSPKTETITIGTAAVLPPPAGISTIAALTLPGQDNPSVKGAIDTTYTMSEYQKIAGWVFVENQETWGQEVYVQFNKPDGTVAQYPALPAERPDIGAAHNNPLYNASGFSALIPLKDGLDINSCTISFGVKNSTGIYKSVPPDKKKPAVKIAIDTSCIVGKYQKITGWVFVAGQDTKGQEVYVQLKKPDGAVVNYSTLPIERPDVGAANNNPLYNASGFRALIPLKDGFDINSCTISLVVKNRNGTYISQSFRVPTRG